MNNKNALKSRRLMVSTGLALFAMFFGAGNIIFPLQLGAQAGQQLGPTALGFLLAGVGVPFLGLFATSLYQGDYWAFFGRLGRVPAFMIISLLIVFLGPLVALPRTVMTTYSTLSPYLPFALQDVGVFNALFCAVIYLLAYRETKVMDLLGWIFSPIKIIAFGTLILLSLRFQGPVLASSLTAKHAFLQAVKQGYNTMDLIAAFFFCSVAFRSIHAHLGNRQDLVTRLTLQASILGSALLSLVYVGFMMAAHHHGQALAHVPTPSMIPAIANLVMGKAGGLFVSISVFFACLATALALSDTCSHYLRTIVFREMVSQKICLGAVVTITFFVSQLEFGTLMYYVSPCLSAMYPALIVLSIMNILHKWKGIKMVRLPVLVSALAGATYVLLTA